MSGFRPMDNVAEDEEEYGYPNGEEVKESAFENKEDARCRVEATKRRLTTFFINLSAIMERLDEQILPAVYRFIAASFNASPAQLGYLTLCRAIVQALSSPLGGFLGHYYNRIHVICAGCTIWGTMTAAFAACNDLTLGYILCGVNGVGLALVIPSGQSLIADLYSEDQRGAAFGALYLFGALGAMVGAIYSTNVGAITVLGLDGWRFAFLSVALVSLVVGLLNLGFGHDPRQEGCMENADEEPESFLGLLAQVKGIVTVPTFLIIVLQGIVGAIPWNALVFMTLYLQLLGFTDFQASLLSAIFLGGTALGGLLGGYVGDVAARISPHHGRIAVCQFSVAMGVPFAWLLIKGLPDAHGLRWATGLYAIVLGGMGLCISWAAPACNNPIFAEIVPAHLRNMVYAFDRSFESAIAACAAPLVGLLAEKVFGFQGSATTGGEAGEGGAAQDLGKARALGNAMLFCVCVPWTLCLLFYTGLHWTYRHDKLKVLLVSEEFFTDDTEEQAPLLRADSVPNLRLRSPRAPRKASLRKTPSCPELLLRLGSAGLGSSV